MFAKINTAGLSGIEGFLVEVEADVQNGLPGFYLTGALSAETREAQFRVMNALKNSGIRMDPRKITVNFSPAAVRKDGTAFDLPIAMAVMAAMGLTDYRGLQETAFLGETGLDGSLKSIRGVLPLAFALKEKGFRRLIIAEENAAEASLAEGLEIIGCTKLTEALEMARRIAAGETSSGGAAQYPVPSEGWGRESYDVDYAEVRGQAYLKRAAEIAVSGRHNLLMSGPAGTGKTMIARRMPTIMPPLTREEDIEISKIYSICGLLSRDRPLLSRHPFRSPHHGISEAAFAGGGSRAMPGEISLASGGILFLDELPLFRRTSLEMLRQPLEDGKITITRRKGSYTYPADLLLAAAMNSCACGYYPDRQRCRCTAAQIRAYVGRLSRPLLERIDLCAEARPVSYRELTGSGTEESSAVIRRRVEAAWQIQQERFAHDPGIRSNSRMGIREIERYCVLGREEQLYMQDIFRRKRLSGRTYHKVLKVARTIADLDQSALIRTEHLEEAAGLRSIEDTLFSPETDRMGVPG